MTGPFSYNSLLCIKSNAVTICLSIPPIGNTTEGGQPWTTDVDLPTDGQWSTVDILPENIIPGWGGNPQTLEGLTEVTGLVIGSSEGQSEAQGTIDVDSIEIMYEP